MRVMGTVLTSALLLSGCSQISEHFYSKKNFNSQSFEGDIADCKRQNVAFMALASSAFRREGAGRRCDDPRVHEGKRLHDRDST
jgi:PBP1b-binding outer membrane lipoprotein LpoB